MAISADSTSRPVPASRRLGSVPWYHAGCSGFSVTALANVPPSDDSMIRAALVRGAISCQTVEEIDRALARELWQIGYVANVQHDPANRAVLLVEISTDR
jgi:hypothetical protein